MNTEEKIPIKFRPDEDDVDCKKPVETTFEKHNFGTSSLYGRTERNITFKQRGSYDEAKFDGAFPRAYLDILRSAFKMIAMFFGRK